MPLRRSTKQPRNGRLLNPRLSNDAKGWLNRRAWTGRAGMDVALCILEKPGSRKSQGGEWDGETGGTE